MNVFRPGDVTYLRIPAPEPKVLAAFFTAVFGWRSRDGKAFEDAGGTLIGHFDPDHEVAGAAGVRPYVYVDDLEATLERARDNGASVATEPYPEGELSVAVLVDPAGNHVGVWTRARS